MGVSFLFTSIYSGLYVCYGVTLEDKYWLIAVLILPITVPSCVMAVLYKPKRTDVGYKRFLYFHFFTLAVVSECGGAVGCFLTNLVFSGWFCLFRIPCYVIAFWLGLKLRASAATLPPQELSDLLCQTVLVKGTTAMGTMLFFSFETVSCFISQDSLSNGQCSNTTSAGMLLSLYLAIFTSVSMVSKTVPKSVQREMSLELSSIVSLKGLRRWQLLQGALMTINAIVSLYLLSFLGAEGNNNSLVGYVGAIGVVSLGTAAIINMTMLVRTRNEHRSRGEMETKQRSVRGISAGQLEEGMFIGAFV